MASSISSGENFRFIGRMIIIFSQSEIGIAHANMPRRWEGKI